MIRAGYSPVRRGGGAGGGVERLADPVLAFDEDGRVDNALWVPDDPPPHCSGIAPVSI
jgi:hypothetical protein